MFARANQVKTLSFSRRALGRAISSTRSISASRSHRTLLLSSCAVAAAGTLWYTSKVIHNDASPTSPAPPVQPELSQKPVAITDDATLMTYACGSNKANIISPATPDIDSVPIPSPVSWLENVALRDLALHEQHAACVDGRGDVYQWGDGFFGSHGQERAPRLTLQGKNITQVQVTSDRVFALSSNGQIYVLASDGTNQPSPPQPASSWGFGWLIGSSTTSHDSSEITPNEKFGRAEKFVSIAAGRDHLLALTSSGRVFAHPITKNANSHGQLGFRKFDIPDPTSHPSQKEAPNRLQVELIPKSVLDPYAFASPAIRSSSSQAPASDGGVTGGVKTSATATFSDRLLELPALKGIKVDQIAVGSRSSYVKTDSGRVLGWGANEYGQIGLGRDVTVDTITKPTEIVLSKSVSRNTDSKCLGVFAGGDLTLFVVERSDGTSIRTVDVLACGNGQWGGLGNSLFRNSQGEPLRAKNVSGLLEFSEETQNLQPITPHAISISPTGHVLLTLDTASRAGPGGGGRDLLAWGANSEYQLGNGKRTSLAAPAWLKTPGEGVDGGRVMLMKKKAVLIRDARGEVWKGGKGIDVEQTAVAGYENSVVYWRIC
ncbi:hypothetical protein JAAARDRAFT_153233 [Jaapia argillacea MUCL 33604]|uniref:Uncharacterized protein n=1 Tax=Jaapia argillacea MUCL 33604 TaxID=933084 RepID=A0A067PXA3_9AGAM|nr:hypothetical protein JAAARDRAFT_153233 [Jaapia argillacea MUCL 33604]